LRLVFACFAAISEALNYDRFFEVLSTSRVSFDHLLLFDFAAVFTGLLPGSLSCLSFSAEP
jgi:hypothetical protein